MNDSPDLYAFVLRLMPERPGAAPEAHGHQAQALFYALVEQIDPVLSSTLHAPAQSKPFTVAVLGQGTGDWGLGTRGRGPTRRSSLSDPQSPIPSPHSLELRVTLMDATLFAPFTQALLHQTAQPAMRLGSTALRLGDVCGTAGSHPWAGYSSFAALHERARPVQRLALRFATPAAFGQGSRADGRARLGLLPTPEAVFGSLARRWNELAPPSLRLAKEVVADACNETLVSAASIETCQFTLNKAPQKGFVGSTTYELPPDPAQARLIALLADAAFFLGVGVKTGRGMGVVKRDT